MAKIKVHPCDPTMYQYWDVATQLPNAFWVGGDRLSWNYNEDDERPTVSPSILNTTREGFRNHVFIRDGKITYLSDCTHEMAGCTVDMVDFPDDWL